jgi:pimeloyl-ACP methyl ester carboxylesterase
MLRKTLIRSRSRSLFLCFAAVLGASLSASMSSAERRHESRDQPVTAVLVHGAFADGSSWSKVIPLLQAQGLRVVAVQNPLTSLADDAAFARRAIDNAKGPVVLVGHSWGGTVITQAGDHPKVKALVYVAAFAPGKGQSTLDLNKVYPTPPGLASVQVDGDGYLSLSPETVARDFAQDASDQEKVLIAATQGAVRGANFEEKVTNAAWETKPSWAIISEQDRMIDPRLLRDMAARINAKVTSVPTGHVPMATRPKDVADVIVAAAASISASR